MMLRGLRSRRIRRFVVMSLGPPGRRLTGRERRFRPPLLPLPMGRRRRCGMALAIIIKEMVAIAVKPQLVIAFARYIVTGVNITGIAVGVELVDSTSLAITVSALLIEPAQELFTAMAPPRFKVAFALDFIASIAVPFRALPIQVMNTANFLIPSLALPMRPAQKAVHILAGGRRRKRSGDCHYG